MPPTIKDFDAERLARLRQIPTASFKLGGETFVVRRNVRPDVIAEVEEVTESAGAREAIDVIDRTILAFVDPKGRAHERYMAVRANDADPVTLEDLTEVLRWLAETYTARPTTPPSSSPRGRRATGISSKAGSRSKAAASKA